MSVATTYTRAQIGIAAPLVTVEADITQGLPQIVIVGLPEAAVRESKDRVKAALVNAGFALPSRRVTVNLAPADLPKQGGRYDLAIALALLAASDQIDKAWIANAEFLGELSLSGKLRQVSGALPSILRAIDAKHKLYLPGENREEAALVCDPNVILCESLSHLVALLKGEDVPLEVSSEPPRNLHAPLSLQDVQGQELAKRALVVAAAGDHNLLMVGPPGTGKTMLAQRLAGLMPDMTNEQNLAAAAIRSVAAHHQNLPWGQRPFRSPHHTASATALVGGGNPPAPGEISLAHEGILFLDELPEFSRHVLEVLREPIESGQITISRAQHQVTYPSRFLLIAAMNPCPCGYYADGTNRCNCTHDQIHKYASKISGPLLDRIDLTVKVSQLEEGVLTGTTKPPSQNQSALNQAALNQQVARARQIMLDRSGCANAYLTSKDIKAFCPLQPPDLKMMDTALQRLGLSVRGYFKTLKIARTIADLEEAEEINTQHLSEALGFRSQRLGE